jgi:hypothetical protein
LTICKFAKFTEERKMVEMEQSPAESVSVSLSTEERYFLQRGISEWQGSARCSDELAVAMGFIDVLDLRASGETIARQLESGGMLSRLDWSRCLLSSEIVFASVSMGSALEWPVVSGLSDEETLQILRSIQEKLIEVCVPIGHMVYGL